MSRNKALDKKRVIERLQHTPIVELACKQVGIARSTYYRWSLDDLEFAAACTEAIELSAATINDMAESQLISGIKDKNMSAITFWLRHHHPRYENRLRLSGNISHDNGVMTLEQQELISKALRMVGLLEAPTQVESNENINEQPSK